MDTSFMDAELVLCGNLSVPKDVQQKVKVHSLPSIRSRGLEVVDKLARNVLKFERNEHFITKVSRTFKPDIWYINTSVLPQVSKLAINNKQRYVVHFHELTSVFDQMKGKILEQMVQNAALNIACSKAVLKNLDLLGGKNNKLFYEHIDISAIQTNKSRISEIHKELNLNQYKYCWAMAGATSPRKGFDLFIDIAAKKPESCFIWIGKQRDHGFNQIQLKRIEKEKINNVYLIEQQSSDYYNFLDSANGFILTSREDPFPLVMIEAAFLQKPIVSFNSGGVVEFVEQNMGSIIESLDISELVKALLDIEEGNKVIDKNRLKSRAEEFDFQKGIVVWQEILKESFTF